MKLLLDTNALIWWLEDSPRLGPRARALIADADNVMLASIVSLWEIAVKWRVGKMHLPATRFADLLADQNVSLLGLEQQHIAAVESLAFHHGDPFDHIILAQAKVEGARIITSDRIMTAYGVPCIGVS